MQIKEKEDVLTIKSPRVSTFSFFPSPSGNLYSDRHPSAPPPAPRRSSPRQLSQSYPGHYLGDIATPGEQRLWDGCCYWPGLACWPRNQHS